MALKRWVWVVICFATVSLFAFIAFVAGTVYVVTRHVDVASATRPSAKREFEQVRAKFAGRVPLIQMTDGEPATHLPDVEQSRPRAHLETLHVVAWDPDKDKIVRATIPFWVVRMAGWKPITVRSGDFDFERIHITPGDLERFGPGLILDHKDRRGARVLVWVE